jgi:hypothetical protein
MPAASRENSTTKQAEHQLVPSLKADVDALLTRFLEADSIRFSQFGTIFNEKEFSTIFLGRLSSADLIEFSENLLKYAASFMFVHTPDEEKPAFILGNVYNKTYEYWKSKQKSERPFLERLFGVYATYCLYFLQPAQYVSQIRVSISQMDSLNAFMSNVLLPEQHFDALFCLFRLMDSNAFTIVPFEHEFNPLLARRFDFDDVNAATVSAAEECEKIPDFPNLKALECDFILTVFRLFIINLTASCLLAKRNCP